MMKLVWNAIRCVALAAAIVAAGTTAAADKARSDEVYPNKSGRLILPFGPGGSTDVIGRIFAHRFRHSG